MERFVLPGDVVGTAEEFGPGEGTYIEGGYIRASTSGQILIDRKNRSAKIIPVANSPQTLSAGDVVVGRITDLKESLAIVCLAFKKGHESRPLFNSEGVLHISHVKKSYVKDIRQVLGLRDIVKAKIIDKRNNSFGLSIVDGDLGVVKAYCGRCTEELHMKDGKLIFLNARGFIGAGMEGGSIYSKNKAKTSPPAAKSRMKGEDSALIREMMGAGRVESMLYNKYEPDREKEKYVEVHMRDGSIVMRKID